MKERINWLYNGITIEDLKANELAIREIINDESFEIKKILSKKYYHSLCESIPLMRDLRKAYQDYQNSEKLIKGYESITEAILKSIQVKHVVLYSERYKFTNKKTSKFIKKIERLYFLLTKEKSFFPQMFVIED